MQQQQYFRKQRLTRALRAAFSGSAAALALGVGLITMTQQSAHAQAANGATFTSLHLFDPTSGDGEYPYGALVLGQDGNFYGTTFEGGANGEGCVYKITPSGTETVIYSFLGNDGDGNTDGSGPDAGLVVDADGNFYGTTDGGGVNNDGTVFKVTAAGVETVLHSFSGTADGEGCESALVLGTDGNFYGTAPYGGASDDGTVFEITTGGTFTTLYSFSGTADGAAPYYSLVQAGDGNFYGVTEGGGASDDGTVFKITPTGTLTSLYSFSGMDGSSPYCKLAIGADGNFYGMTDDGGANGNGSIFKITPAGVFASLYSFSATDSNGDNADGTFPAQSLLAGTDGNFYGMAENGGANGTGTIFQITSSGTFTLLYTFSADGSNPDIVSEFKNSIAKRTGATNTDGAYPDFNDLTEASDGTLYGTVEGGGNNDAGTIFKLTVPSLTASNGPSVTGSGVRFDYNGDGHPDVLWFNTATNALSIFDMDDTSIVQLGNTFAGPAPGSGWQPVASVDVNGDGFPDLIWWNSQTGELSDWTMQGNSPLQEFGDFATVGDTDWKPVAAADVVDNTTGAPTTWELVFQNTATGEISRWNMSGTTVSNYGGDLASLGAGSPWQIVGAPDLDGDGKSDLLFWNDTTGEVSYWSTDLANSHVNTVSTSFSQVADTNWRLVGSEDTNGDGHSDYIWWNASTGEESRWLMNGVTVEQYGGNMVDVADTDWQPTAIR